MFVEDYLKKTHVEIIPQEIFKSRPESGLRDVILEVIRILKQDRKVVVNDENSKKSTWESYINVVKKKVPQKSLVLMSVYPKYGIKQVYWSQQYCAENEPVSDRQVSKWFDGESDILYNKVDDPSLMTGLETRLHKYPLILKTKFEPTIPALFIQCEAVLSDGTVKAGVVKTCQLWTQKNPHGRVIFLLNLTKYPSNLLQKIHDDTIQSMKTLVSKVACPVYLYSIDKDAVQFSVPPSPGVLASIQKDHGVDLHNQRTVLLYQDQLFSTMAASAGVSCVSATKVLQKPSLILNRMVFTASRPPAFLQNIEVRVTEESSPSIPLLDQQCNDQGYIEQDVGHGINVYLFGPNKDSFDKYQEKFEGYLLNGKTISEEERTETTQISSDEEVSINNKTTSRELPRWMLTKSGTGSLSSHRSDSISSTSSTIEAKARTTSYVLSEQELVEVAMEILKQAGQEDVLQRIQGQQDSNGKLLTDTRTQTTTSTTTCTNLSDLTCKPSSCRKRRISKNTKSSSDQTVNVDVIDIDGGCDEQHGGQTMENSSCKVRRYRSTRSVVSQKRSEPSQNTVVIDSDQEEPHTSYRHKSPMKKTETKTISKAGNTHLEYPSSLEPSLNVNPAQLFQNMPDSASVDRISPHTIIPTRSKVKEQEHKKKPDLSFLDDIFG